MELSLTSVHSGKCSSKGAELSHALLGVPLFIRRFLGFIEEGPTAGSEVKIEHKMSRAWKVL